MPLYFLTCVLLFWIPGAALMVVAWRRLDRAAKGAFWLTCAVMAVVTFGMEYVYLWADIWSFSEAYDPLLGVEILGAPIEEFMFWFGATPFVLGAYLVFSGWIPAARRLPRTPKRSGRRRGGHGRA